MLRNCGNNVRILSEKLETWLIGSQNRRDQGCSHKRISVHERDNRTSTSCFSSCRPPQCMRRRSGAVTLRRNPSWWHRLRRTGQRTGRQGCGHQWRSYCRVGSCVGPAGPVGKKNSNASIIFSKRARCALAASQHNSPLRKNQNKIEVQAH